MGYETVQSPTCREDIESTRDIETSACIVKAFVPLAAND